MSGGDGSRPTIDLVEVDAFADAAHRGQTRESGAPYVEHPRAVRAILEDEFPEAVDDIVLAIALLHDVLEDCDVHPSILLERWGREVQEGVTLLSWNVRALDLERDARVYHAGLRRGPRAVRLVKGADRMDNMRAARHDDSPERRRRYVKETEKDLLPILNEAHETWLVERLEELVQELRRIDAA